uniref:Uncharacterized protein n=1 Tax=Acrobeloides nanus TaxID=290746 RepID=A0A914DVD7_9BILA
MGLGARLFFKNAPDRIIQGVQIREVWRPLSNLSLWADVHFDEVWTIFFEKALNLFCLVQKKRLKACVEAKGGHFE